MHIRQKQTRSGGISWVVNYILQTAKEQWFVHYVSIQRWVHPGIMPLIRLTATGAEQHDNIFMQAAGLSGMMVHSTELASREMFLYYSTDLSIPVSHVKSIVASFWMQLNWKAHLGQRSKLFSCAKLAYCNLQTRNVLWALFLKFLGDYLHIMSAQPYQLGT